MKTEEEIREMLKTLKAVYSEDYPPIKFYEWVLGDQMNEVEKMYRNAGIERIEKSYCSKGYCIHQPNIKFGANDTCRNCSKGHFYLFPEFTTEKQIELIKWLGKRGLLNIIYSKDKNTYHLFNDRCIGAFCYDIATAIATLVQCELDFCSPEEKQQVKGILE